MTALLRCFDASMPRPATIANLFKAFLYFPVAHYISKVVFFSTQHQEQPIILSHLPIKQLQKRKKMDVPTAEQYENGNICTSKQSCNRTEQKILFTTTVGRL